VVSDELPYVMGIHRPSGYAAQLRVDARLRHLLHHWLELSVQPVSAKYGAARAVQIDIDGSVIGMRYPTELNIVAAAAPALDMLIPLLQERPDHSWRTTVEKNASDWTDSRLIVWVFHNNDLNQVTWELCATGGAPKFETSQSFPDVSYAAVADAMGISGIANYRDDDIGPARDRALAADGPTVLDIRCDPEMLPIPPHAPYEQIKELTSTIPRAAPKRYT
jgi:thiamine pyrophosphate-dependent acetolactate synthase large subunit-like protein